MLCFLFPERLTTPEFRAQYDVEIMRRLLEGSMLFAGACAIRSLLQNPRKLAGLTGGGLTLLALALGGSQVEVGEVGRSSVYLSLDYLVLSLLAMALIFVPLELFLPRRTDQTKFHAEWKTDLVYFIVAHLLVQVVAAVTQRPVWALLGSVELERIHEAVAGLPFPVQVFAALLIADLFQYVTHRTFHRAPYLWRFHAVHHSTRTMDWLAGSRLHVVDVIATRMLVYLPLYAAGFEQSVLLATSPSSPSGGAQPHQHEDPLRLLRATVRDPADHHWHPPRARRRDKNFAVHFPWIDRLFGTYHAPAGVAGAVGLDDAGSRRAT